MQSIGLPLYAYQDNIKYYYNILIFDGSVTKVWAYRSDVASMCCVPNRMR
jgi:hypothetical protein